jgi:hypothetical protein
MTARLADAAIKYVQGIWEHDPVTQKPKIPDIPTMLELQFDDQPKRDKYAADLKDLESKCLAVLGAGDAVKQAAFVTTVPPDPVRNEDVPEYSLRLWQLAFEERLSMKGASPAHAVKAAMRTFMTKGNNFPIDVLFRLSSNQAVGSVISNFKVGISNGFAVVCACHLLCMAAIAEDFHGKGMLDTTAAGLYLKCLRIKGKYEPQATMQEQVQATLSTKNQAASRTRPTTLQQLFLPGP